MDLLAPAIFDVYEAILKGLPTCLTEWRIYDGYPVTSDPADFIAVGVEDPWSTSDATAAEAELDWAHATSRHVDEQGTITLALVASDGAGDAAVPRAKIRQATGQIDAWLREKQQPVVTAPRAWAAAISRIRLGQDQTASEGALCVCLLVISYTARI